MLFDNMIIMKQLKVKHTHHEKKKDLKYCMAIQRLISQFMLKIWFFIKNGKKTE